MNALCQSENKKEVRENVPISNVDRDALQEEAQGSVRASERPMRLKTLIAAAVRVWELKRGLD